MQIFDRKGSQLVTKIFISWLLFNLFISANMLLLFLTSTLIQICLCQVSSQLWKTIHVSEQDWQDRFSQKLVHQLQPDDFDLVICGIKCHRAAENCEGFVFDKLSGQCTMAIQVDYVQSESGNFPVFVKADKLGQYMATTTTSTTTTSTSTTTTSTSTTSTTSTSTTKTTTSTIGTPIGNVLFCIIDKLS